MTFDSVRLERDFYLRVLQLDEHPDVEGLLHGALSLILEIAGARQGYIELAPPEGSDKPFSLSRDCTDDDLTNIRTALSGGIIAEAMATGQTIQTASALNDPRFSGRASVRQNRIDAVLCAPIGSPPIGIVYLQGRNTSGIFTEDDITRLELLARHLAPRADRLLQIQQHTRHTDYTREIRRKLGGAGGIIGHSEALAQVLKQAHQIAPIDIPVLLSGPTGTGKTALARLIADHSGRRGPFLEVSCANLPESLIESELFGAVQGAHSTAVRSVQGKVAAAAGGTLFLDEITELSLAAQARLLQLLQSRIYYPLGATQPVKADVRIIAASHRSLSDEVTAGRFREDLMYRLDVFPIALPPLSERSEDISLLAEHFCRQAIDTHSLPSVKISAAAMSALNLTSWPGNIRQLANTITTAVIRAATSGASHITPNHLFPGAVAPQNNHPLSFQDATHRFQQKLLEQTLEQTNWNVLKAAQQLSLARSHIYNLIKRHGLKR